MKAENYMELIETIVGSILASFGILFITMQEYWVGFYFFIISMFFFFGGLKKVNDWKNRGKEWREEEV